jgi:hypothetical protein
MTPEFLSEPCPQTHPERTSGDFVLMKKALEDGHTEEFLQGPSLGDQQPCLLLFGIFSYEVAFML